MKKSFSLLLTLLLMLSLTAVPALGQEQPEWKYAASFRYLESYNGPGGDVVIPDTVDGHPILAVSGYLFYQKEGITSVVFPEGLKIVGYAMLTGLDSLKSVTLPESLQVISGSFLSRVPLLEELTIPANVRYIGTGSITWCESLKRITFEGPCPLFIEPEACFYRLAEDVTVFVPEDQLDQYRAALAPSTLTPEQIQSSGHPAVPWSDPAAPAVTVDESGCLTSVLSDETIVIIPAEVDGQPVTSIGSKAFQKHNWVCSVTLPEGVRTIGEKAFTHNFTGTLYEVNLPDSVEEIGAGAFKGFGGPAVRLPASLKAIPDNCFANSYLHGSLTIPDAVTTIGSKAFYYSYLQEVSFPAGLESIGTEAFAGWSLKRLVFRGPVLPAIAEDAFKIQSNPIEVALPWDATDDQLAAAQAALEPLEQTFTVTRAEKPAPEPTPEPAAHTPGALSSPSSPSASGAGDPPAAVSGGSWTQYKGFTYYTDASGKRVTGWVEDGGLRYYMHPQYGGRLHTGWLTVGRDKYYFLSDGAMATGWQQIKGLWYCFGADGRMLTGWLRDEAAEAQQDPPGSKEVWRWCNGKGVMVHGWKEINGRWEFFDDEGVWHPEIRP